MENIHSKVPRINFEIPNYKFFHSPSQREKNDSRFIGRDRLINRLTNILQNNESKTGSYLITGYRGMGKSSFVNRVLNEITLTKNHFANSLPIWFSIWLSLGMILKIITTSATNYVYYYYLAVLTVAIVCSVARLFTYKSTMNFTPYFMGRKKIVIHCFLYAPIGIGLTMLLFLTIYSHQNRLTADYRIASALIVLAFTIIHYGIKYQDRCKHLYFKFLYSITKNKKDLSKYFKFQIRSTYKNIILFIKRIGNKRKRVVIHLNLGHEILDEKEISSLIARNLETEFKKYAFSIKRQWVYYTVKITSLIIISYFLTDYASSKLIKDVLDNIKFLWIRDFFTTVIDTASYFFTTFIDKAYYFCTEYIFGNGHHINYLYIPIFFFLNLVLTGISGLYFNSKHAGYSSRRQILKNLKFLNANIDAVIKTEKTNEINTSSKGSYLGSRFSETKEYPMAGIRQIEKNLITILDEIENLAPLILKPEFIFVFDELDKIDPKTNRDNDKDTEKSSINDFDGTILGFSGGTGNRSTKRNVLRLLGNLKYFLTTAKAKFIFISGRELYDAYLADVSDRQFAISSIFHDVIYVDSFLSDSSDGKDRDITSMVEHYLCKILIPEWYIDYLMFEKIQSLQPEESFTSEMKYSLLTLEYYLKYLFDNKILEKAEEIERIHILLYQFINYLTHVSNGAPKKMSNLVERHIIFKKRIEQASELNIKYIGKQKRGMFLSFGYVDQCKIGFIHYLAHPIMLGLMNNVSTYGDKLLVSSSFLIDHIFKFHNNGFSWRNLENTPEILDTSHTPELRSLIQTIISYLSQTHISSIISGLYVFKFPKKISEEIQYISKLSEEASALFNFTLDESLSVKNHYKRLLESYIDLYTKEKTLSGTDKPDLIHTISNIHHILGDLYLLDEDFNDAIFEYQNCIQFCNLNFKDYDPHNDSHILLFVRNMLKLGLAYEKRKTYNSAYVTYSKLISILIDFRYLDESQLGLKFKIEPLNNWRKYGSILYREENMGDAQSQDLFYKNTLPEFNKEKDENRSMILKGEEINSGFAMYTTPIKNKIISRLSMFEDMRLMYQALLAKLFVLEKQQLGGISRENLDVLEGEFTYLHLATNLKNKFLISADFFKKLGDILFYKNGLITRQSSNLFDGLYFWDYDLQYDIERFSKNQKTKRVLASLYEIPAKGFDTFVKSKIDEDAINDTLFKIIFEEYFDNIRNDSEAYSALTIFLNKHELDLENSLKTINGFISSDIFDPPKYKISLLKKALNCCKIREELLRKRISAPCYACKYYNRSLKIFADNLLKSSENEYPSTKALLFLKALDDDQFSLYSSRANFNQSLASTLGGFGDVMVSCSTEEDSISSVFLSTFLNYIDNRKNAFRDNYYSQLEKALLYYLASAKYYKRSSNHRESAFMYKKMIKLLIQYIERDLDSQKSILDSEMISKIDAQITRRIIQNTHSSYDHIHFTEASKWTFLKEKIRVENQQSPIDTCDYLSPNQLSIFPELEDTIYAHYRLMITSKNHDSVVFKKLCRMPSLSSQRVNSSIYNRLISLRFKAFLNKDLLKNESSFDIDQVCKKMPCEDFFKCFDAIKHEKEKVEKVENIILDSIFCLQKFIEIIYPHNQTTLFNHGYVANIYKDMYEWTILYELILKFYSGRKNKDVFSTTICGICPTKDTCEKNVFEYKSGENLNRIKARMKELVDDSQMHMVNSCYLAEMAIKKFQDAFAMHKEGKTYKDTIENMFFLNDDLDNESFKFYLALERYRINCSDYNKSMNELKERYSNTDIFKIKNYLPTDKKIHS
jgi:hypothetical protein